MMKYTKPEVIFCMMNSTDVITASNLTGKVFNYNTNDEDNLDWNLSINL